MVYHMVVVYFASSTMTQTGVLSRTFDAITFEEYNSYALSTVLGVTQWVLAIATIPTIEMGIRRLK